MIALAYQVFVASHPFGDPTTGITAALEVSARASVLGVPSLLITKAKA